MCNNPRVICIGANLESLRVLKEFYLHDLEVLSIVTLPEQKFQKGSDYQDLRPFAKSQNINVITTNDINSKKTKTSIRALKPDYIFVLGWSQILDQELLEIPSAGVIGSHPSDLPYGAGRAPVPWSILEGLSKSAVTFFQMVSDVDAGKIYLKKSFSIPGEADSKILYNLVSENLAAGFVEIYQKILVKELKGVEQNMKSRFVRARRIYEDGFLDFNKSCVEIKRLIRATTSPYPGGFTFFSEGVLTVWECEEKLVKSHKGAIGQILKKTDQSLLVQCSDGALWLKDFELNGKSFSAKEFQLGDRLGFNPSIEVFEIKKRLTILEKKVGKSGFN